MAWNSPILLTNGLYNPVSAMTADFEAQNAKKKKKENVRPNVVKDGSVLIVTLDVTKNYHSTKLDHICRFRFQHFIQE